VPITFIPQIPTVVGPGYQLFVQTDLVGPIGVDGWDWLVTGFQGPDFETPCVSWTFPSDGQHSIVINNFKNLTSPIQGRNVSQGETIHLQVSLQTLTTTEDESDAVPVTWDGSGEMWRWQQQQTTAPGSFTQTDRDTLNQTSTTGEETNQLSQAINAAVQVPLELAGQAVTLTVGQILTSNLLDALTTLDLSGGITCNPIRYDASLNHLYGVQLLVSSVPEGWRFQTPDNAWGFHDLAVITIVRGNAQLERHGIHALSHTIYPLPGLPFPWAVNLDLPLQPPDYHINVDWAEGVCGQLIGLGLP
jgi:hypothetical protein